MENVIKPVVASLSWPPTAPWLDLPQHITDLILERLSLPDYIRFAAVCTKWRSIQRDHRLSHAPLPPPMVTIPWLCVLPNIPSLLHVIPGHDFDPIACYNPVEKKFYSLPFPEVAVGKEAIVSSHGWVILIDFYNAYEPFVLLNPVSGDHFLLPSLPQEEHAMLSWSMSAPPTDPHCVIMTTSRANVLLWRVGDSDWTKFPCPIPFTGFQHHVSKSVFCKGKFYCKCRDDTFFVVDPVAGVSELLDMNWSHPLSNSELSRVDHLVESDGDLLMVMLFFSRDSMNGSIQGSQVFKADFSRKMWVKVETLGNRVLFVSETCTFPLLTDDAVGVEENCVYFKDCLHNAVDFYPYGRDCTAWTGFHLGDENVIHGPPVPYDDRCDPDSMLNSFWITPCIAPVNPR